MALELGIKMNFNWRQPPKPVQIAVVVVPIIIVLALGIFLKVMPAYKETGKLRKQIDEQEKEIAKKQSLASKLDVLLVENQKLKEKLKELESRLPEEGEISSLLKQLNDLCMEARLTILTWKPNKNRNHSSGIVYEVPVSITMEGSYHEIGGFFASLTTLDRIINAEDIVLGNARLSKDKGKLNLSLNFTAVTFTAVPEKKIVEPAKKK